jgi:hypothetical protein
VINERCNQNSQQLISDWSLVFLLAILITPFVDHWLFVCLLVGYPDYTFRWPLIARLSSCWLFWLHLSLTTDCSSVFLLAILITPFIDHWMFVLLLVGYSDYTFRWSLNVRLSSCWLSWLHLSLITECSFVFSLAILITPFVDHWLFLCLLVGYPDYTFRWPLIVPLSSCWISWLHLLLITACSFVVLLAILITPFVVANYQWSTKGVIWIANKKTSELSVINERCNQDSQQEDKRTFSDQRKV